MDEKAAANVDEYFSGFPEDAQNVLIKIRKIIHDTVPGIKEKISWGVPAFYLKKIVIQIGCYKDHISIYPGARAIGEHKDLLEGFAMTKGGFKIPYGKEVPTEILKRIIIFNLGSQ